MKIAALQTVSTPDVDRNLEAAARLIAQACAQGAQLVALPEYFCLMGRHDTDKLAHAETPGDGPIQSFLSQQAKQHGLWLIGGTLPLRADDARARTQRLLRLRPRRHARRALRQDPSLPLRDRARELRRSARARSRQCAGGAAGRRAARRPVGVLRPALSRAVPRAVLAAVRCVERAGGLHLHDRAARIGSCCCARAPSRTSATCWPRRRAARTRTAAAPGATAWWSIPGARCWRCSPRARAW